VTDLTEAAAGRLVRDEGPPLVLPNGDDLALSLGTDFFDIAAGLDEGERALLDRVRDYCDTQVAPVAGEYWERAEFPTALVPGYRALGVAGGTLAGYGCPGLSAVVEDLVAAELARGDGSIATFNAVHSGLAMASIGLLGS
jgi:glutaryl-CoA dehydrogenase